MRIYIDTELSNLSVPFEPTSVYVDGNQIQSYMYNNYVIFFDNVVPAGSTVTFIPPDAIRFLDDNIQTVNITQTGIHSVFSDPFGMMVFSLDAVTWFKSLTHSFPATIYCKLTPQDAVLDFKCKADVEVVIWRGTDQTQVNQDGNVEVNEIIPVDAVYGGLEYNVY